MNRTHSVSGATVMVTGGCGFIGSHLVRALLARGVERVVVVDSLRYGDRTNLSGAAPERIELVQHTLGHDPKELLLPLFANVNFLFHLAAEKHNQSKDDPVRVYTSNLLGMHTLLELAVAAGVQKVVYTSSLYAYGRMQGPPFVESELPEPRTVYGVTKLAGEHMLRYFQAATGLDYTVLRYLFVYGPRQYAGMGYKSVIMKNFERLLEGLAPTIYGDGRQVLDYVFVDDVVEATIAAMEGAPAGAVYNVGGGTEVSMLDAIEVLGRVAGRRLELLRAPRVEGDVARTAADTSRIEADLGWKSRTSIEEGLEAQWHWAADRVAAA